MANTLKIGSTLSKADWSLMMQDVYALRDLGKVAHIQPYLPGLNGSPTQQPFIFKINGCWKCVSNCRKTTLGQSTPHLKLINLGSHYMQSLHEMPWE